MTNKVSALYQTPRGKAGRTHLPRWLFEAPIWNVAPLETKLCFVEIAALYDGANNGFLKFGISDAQRKLRTTRKRAAQALVDLNDLGLAEDRIDTSRRRLWSLVHLHCDATGRPATKPWETKLARRVDEHDKRWWEWTSEEVKSVWNDCRAALEGNTCARFSDREYAEDFLSTVTEKFPSDQADLGAVVKWLNSGRFMGVDHPPFRFHERANMESKFTPEQREAFEVAVIQKGRSRGRPRTSLLIPIASD